MNDYTTVSSITAPENIIRQMATTIVVGDFEYLWDRELHQRYLKREGSSATKEIRWPFKRVVAGSWVVVRFPGCMEKPVVEPFQSMSNPEHDETEIVRAFFDVLKRETISPERMATWVSWGSEAVDSFALHRVAQHQDIRLPLQLCDLGPNPVGRIDLCEEFYNGKIGVHLDEYAINQDLPGKPVPGKQVAKLAEAGDWKAVEEQCLVDVLTTAVIAARHLASISAVGQTGSASTDTIVERFCQGREGPVADEIAQWQMKYRCDLAMGKG